jgi:hypothetical protein
VEREHVVHAERVGRERPRDDQPVVTVLVGKRRRPERLRREQLGVGLGDPARRVAQRLGVDVGAERAQQMPAARCAAAWSISRSPERRAGCVASASGCGGVMPGLAPPECDLLRCG